MRTLLQSLAFHGGRRQHGSWSQRCKLSVEALEDRSVPAVINEFLLPVGSPIGITAGPDGNVWFTATTSQGMPDQVGRITPTGAISEFPLSRSFFLLQTPGGSLQDRMAISGPPRAACP